jgi:hypothetical protein
VGEQVRISEVTDTVTRCVPRHDGGWMVVTKKGSSGVAPQEIPTGSRVVIRDGKAERKSL